MKCRLFLPAAIALLVVGVGFAQTQTDGSDPDAPSNTADVSGNLFAEANDLYLSPTGFDEIESSVLFLQFDMPSTFPLAANQGFEIGAGTTFGDLYTGLYFGSIFPGTSGTIESIQVDENFTVDANGLITGRTTSRDESSDYVFVSYNHARAIVGLGGVGFGIDFVQDSSSSYGNFVPDFTMPAGPAWGAVNVDTTALPAATTFTTYDSAGNVTSTSVEGYAEGFDRGGYAGPTYNQIGGDILAGVGLAVGGINIDVSGEVGVFRQNNNQFAAFESYNRVVGSGSAITYEPTTALPGATAAEISDLTTYFYDEAHEYDQRLLIDPMVGVDATYALAEWVRLEGGVWYDGEIPIRTAKYVDVTGTEQRIGGTANTYSSVEVTTAVNPADPTLTERTTTVTNAAETQDISGSTHYVVPDLGVVLEPSERFRAGISYVPRLTFEGNTTTYAGTAKEVVTVENGDGSSGAGDSVTETTVTRSGYTVSSSTRSLRNRVRTAAQFFLVPERLRINLGAEVDNLMVSRSTSETVTAGMTTYEVREALDSTDPAEEDFVRTDYQVDSGLTDPPQPSDHEQSRTEAGSSTVAYEAGLTFFFDDNMFLDLRMDAGGGDIWNTNQWSLEMTILF